MKQIIIAIMFACTVSACTNKMQNANTADKSSIENNDTIRVSIKDQEHSAASVGISEAPVQSGSSERCATYKYKEAE